MNFAQKCMHTVQSSTLVNTGKQKALKATCEALFKCILLVISDSSITQLAKKQIKNKNIVVIFQSH